MRFRLHKVSCERKASTLQRKDYIRNTAYTFVF